MTPQPLKPCNPLTIIILFVRLRSSNGMIRHWMSTPILPPEDVCLSTLLPGTTPYITSSPATTSLILNGGVEKAVAPYTTA